MSSNVQNPPMQEDQCERRMLRLTRSCAAQASAAGDANFPNDDNGRLQPALRLAPPDGVDPCITPPRRSSARTWWV
jgi:hypothetical protein